MNKKQERNSTKSNIVYNMVYQILVMILPFITAPYISRVFGQDGVGMYTYTYSIAHYFVLFSVMGLTNYGNRSIAKVRDNAEELSRMFSEIYSMQIIFAACSLIGYWCLILFMSQEYRTLLMIQSLYVLSSLFDISWFFFGIEKFKMMVIRNGTVKSLTTILVFVFVKTRNDIWKYTLIISLGFVISNIYLFLCIRKNVKFRIPKTKDIVRHIKPNLILFIPVIAVSLYRIMDKIMLGVMGTMSQTGLYENADKLVTLPLTIISSIGTVMMPKMANLYAKGECKKSFTLIRDSMQLIMFLSCGMMFGMAAISARFVPIYYGIEFRECSVLVIVLIPVLLFDSIANVIRTQYLIPMEKDKSYILSVICGAAVNLIINTCLIGTFGAFGAVLGTLAAEFTVMLIQCIAVRKKLEFNVYLKDSWEFIVAGSLMFFSVKLAEMIIPNNFAGIFIEIILGIIVYTITAAVMCYFLNKDRYKKVLNLIAR